MKKFLILLSFILASCGEEIKLDTPYLNKPLWISTDIFRDELKLASIHYAMKKWQSTLNSAVSLFQFKGEIESDYSFDSHNGKNVIMLVSELSNKSSPQSVEDNSAQVLGQTKTWVHKNAKHIALLKDSSVVGGYCYERGIQEFLGPSSSELLRGSTCRADDDDRRRNFVHVITHELGHYLGYDNHSSDRASVMNERMGHGAMSYHFEEVIEWFRNIQK